MALGDPQCHHWCRRTDAHHPTACSLVERGLQLTPGQLETLRKAQSHRLAPRTVTVRRTLTVRVGWPYVAGVLTALTAGLLIGWTL